ncbi:unnamed protein product [Paramecium primaurelia]|uniref:Transmembrane protein n=1 Tax=Paramecium primaurelia TaxID=5886 RepID=A0A8S1NWU1_PARPR|nr:unnamed protein product [Paramecium primaurelia]
MFQNRGRTNKVRQQQVQFVHNRGRIIGFIFYLNYIYIIIIIQKYTDMKCQMIEIENDDTLLENQDGSIIQRTNCCLQHQSNHILMMPKYILLKEMLKEKMKIPRLTLWMNKLDRPFLLLLIQSLK